MIRKHQIGVLGEDLACKFLRSKGYFVIDRNYARRPFGELDIICTKNGVLNFFEVKSVSCEISDEKIKVRDRHRPEDNIHKYKIERLKKTAICYLSDKKIDPNKDWLFGVVTVRIDSDRKTAKIKLFENIVL